MIWHMLEFENHCGVCAKELVKVVYRLKFSGNPRNWRGENQSLKSSSSTGCLVFSLSSPHHLIFSFSLDRSHSWGHSRGHGEYGRCCHPRPFCGHGSCQRWGCPDENPSGKWRGRAVRLMARSWCHWLYLPQSAGSIKLCFDSTGA